VGSRRDVLAEVAEADFHGAEQFVVGGRDEGLDHLVDQREGLGEELLAEAVAALGRGFSPFAGRARA
jgi:hypothetical protein